MKIGILGAGVIGLSTAVRLQQLLGSTIDTTIIADKFYQDVVSYVAAGAFRAEHKLTIQGYTGSRKDPGLDIVQISYQQWMKLLQKHPKEAGVIELEGYDLHYPSKVKDDQGPLYRKILPKENTRQLTQEELTARFPTLPAGSSGYEIKTVLVSPPTYLNWLMNQFKNQGGKTEKRRITDLNELSDEFDVLVNCTGYLAGKVTDDKDIVPARGQVYRAEIPERRGKMLMITTGDERPVYFYDTPDGMVIGGTKQIGNWSPDLSFEDHQHIMRELTKFLPDISNLESRITSAGVGHRPHRDKGIRMETEVRVNNGRKFLVVHHYGHGSFGISQSWGSAVLAAEVVQGLLMRSML